MLRRVVSWLRKCPQNAPRSPTRGDTPAAVGPDLSVTFDPQKTAALSERYAAPPRITYSEYDLDWEVVFENFVSEYDPAYRCPRVAVCYTLPWAQEPGWREIEGRWCYVGPAVKSSIGGVFYHVAIPMQTMVALGKKQMDLSMMYGPSEPPALEAGPATGGSQEVREGAGVRPPE